MRLIKNEVQKKEIDNFSRFKLKKTNYIFGGINESVNPDDPIDLRKLLGGSDDDRD